jgi:hypothetical protein
MKMRRWRSFEFELENADLYRKELHPSENRPVSLCCKVSHSVRCRMALSPQSKAQVQHIQSVAEINFDRSEVVLVRVACTFLQLRWLALL